MKRSIFALLSTSFLLVSCSVDIPEETSTEMTEHFSLTVDANEKALTNGSATFVIDIADDYYLKAEPDKLAFTVSLNSWDYSINRDYSAEKDNIYRWKLSTSEQADFTVSGHIGKIQSSNTLELSSVLSDEKITTNLENVLNQTGGLRFGETYNIGISAKASKEWSIEGADGVLSINDEGKLEVIGMGASRLTLRHREEVVEEFYYAVGHSILVTNIKSELIKAGVINTQSETVTNSMLSQVKELSLATELENDIECVVGLRFLTELERIDISNNHLADVSWLTQFTKLKWINLSHNRITDFDPIVNNQHLEYLDASYNRVMGISQIKFMQSVTYLDLSHNQISDISDVSTSYGLVSLFLNDNPLQVFQDKLSGLSNLRELGVGHCNIPYTTIKSLNYINQLTYLDISGTNPDQSGLNSIATMSNLKQLVLSDCSLKGKPIAVLNALSGLEMLDISDNKLEPTDYEGTLDGASFVSLKTLRFGGNYFLELPSFASFPALEELDLTASHNLMEIASLSGTSIKSLIVDDCSLLEPDTFNNAIASMASLEHLSIVNGFAFMNESNFNYLMGRVDAGELSLRFMEDRYVDNNTVYNYRPAVFFSLDALFDVCNAEGGSYILDKIGNCREIILSLVNDTSDNATARHNMKIAKGLFKLSLFGNKYKTYQLSFDLEDRKESTFTFNLVSFANSTPDRPFYTAEPGAVVYVEAKDGSYITQSISNYKIRNCECDNGWNPNQKTSFEAAYNLKSDIICPVISGVIYSEGRYRLTSRDNFKIFGIMKYDWNRIEYKDGGLQPCITDDYNANIAPIYGTSVTAEPGRGFCVAFMNYEGGFSNTKTTSNFFEGKVVSDQAICCTGSDLQGRELTSINVIIVFEVWHWREWVFFDKCSNWRYDININF